MCHQRNGKGGGNSLDVWLIISSVVGVHNNYI